MQLLLPFGKRSVKLIVNLFSHFGVWLEDRAPHGIKKFEDSSVDRKAALHYFVKRFQRVVGPVLGAECRQPFGTNFLDPEVLRVGVELEQGLTGVRHRHGVSNASPDFEELRNDFIDRQMRKSEEHFVDVIHLVIGFYILTQRQICKG
jgi:hypothetical protein